MRGKTITIFLFAVLSLPAVVQAKTPPLTPAQSTFVKNYLKALRTHDAALMQSLTDPQSVTCINKVSKIWFDQTVHALTVVHALTDDQIAHDPAVSFDDFMTTIPPGVFFPDPPQKTVTFKWTPAAGQDQQAATYQAALIQNKQEIFQALPCPTPDNVKERDAYFEGKGYKPPAP